MNIPKEYSAKCWTTQEIITDQHLRIASLGERVEKLTSQRENYRLRVLRLALAVLESRR